MKLNSVTRAWDVPLSSGIVLFVTLALAPLFGWALAWESWIILGATVMVALVPIGVRWPVVSTFGLYVLVVPFDSVKLLADAGGTTLSKPLGVLAAAVLAVAGLMERRLGRPPMAALFWGLFMVWATLSAMWTINPEKTFGRLPTALSLFFLYVIAVSIRPSRKEFRWVCLLVVVGGAIAAALAYLYGLEGATEASVRGRLVIGDRASNPNKLGTALIVPLALAMAGVVGLNSALQRAMALGFLGLIGGGMFISMSRSAIVAIIATISVLLYRLRVRWQILAAVVVLLALAATMPDAFFARMSRVFTGDDDTGSGRTEIWKVGLKALEEFGLFGAGLSNFHEAYSIYVVPEGLSGHGVTAHNVYLLVWIELGIVGLALMLAALGCHLLAVHRARKEGRGGVALAAVEAGCVGVLVLTLFLDDIWRKEFWLAWILLTWATHLAGQSDDNTRLSSLTATQVSPRQAGS